MSVDIEDEKTGAESKIVLDCSLPLKYSLKFLFWRYMPGIFPGSHDLPPQS